MHVVVYHIPYRHSCLQSLIPPKQSQEPSVMSNVRNSFNTMEIRPWECPQARNSLDVATPIHSNAPPMGLNWLDIDKKTNTCIRAYIDNIATDVNCKTKATVHLDSPHDTILYSAGCTWLDVCEHDRDFQFGTYATGEMIENPGYEGTRITFDRPFYSEPKVIVWIQELDVSNSDNCRIRASVPKFDTTGFTMKVETWGKTKVNNARVSWVAYPASRSNIASGIFKTADIREYKKTEQQEHSKDIPFDKKFGSVPCVYVGLCEIDVSKNYNLRLKALAKNVTAKGMTISIDTWFDTVLYQASACWLAVQNY